MVDTALAVTSYLLDLIAETPPPAQPSEVAAAYRRLSSRYRLGLPTPTRLAPVDVAAYATARLPATLAAATVVLAEVRDLLPGWDPHSCLDVGAGLGTAGWAAAAVFQSLSSLVFLDRAAEMVAWGRRLARHGPIEAITNAHWVTGDALRPNVSADLVVAAYVLGELPAVHLSRAVNRWWASSMGGLVVIEPGTPAGYQRIIRARELLIGQGATIAAPCPTEGRCPLADDDWCHFATRLTRQPAHRAAKTGTLGFEDEKFSYLAATVYPVARKARVIRPPQRRTGHVVVDLCTQDGVTQLLASKRDRNTYRQARRLRWGDRANLPHQPDP